MLNILFAPGKKTTKEQAGSTTVPPARPASPVVGLLGAKGGVGATTTALNLAFSFKSIEGGTTILDANLQQPDVALLLNREPEYSLLDIVGRREELDLSLFESCCLPVGGPSRPVRVLSGPPTGAGVARTNLSQVAELLDGMRHFSGLWLLDLPGALDRHLVSVTDRCHLILLVLEPTIASIAASRRWLSIFADLGYPASKVMCVVNRSGTTDRLIEERIELCLRGYAVERLPNAFSLHELCTTFGEPAVVRQPRDPYSQAVVRLAARVQSVLASPEDR